MEAQYANGIVAQRVVKNFGTEGSGVHILKGIDMVANSGEVIAVLGRSGSGKTTFLSLLGALDRPSDGKIHILGTETSGASDASMERLRRSAIGFVFQSFNLLPLLTVAENVDLPLRMLGLSREERRQRVQTALGQVGLGRYLSRLPEEISGGEQQRVAVARALAKKSRIVLADEPTGHLDSLTAERIFGVLQSAARDQGAVVIIATHDGSVAAKSDRVLRIHDGILTESR
jgi:putative ABC transport system ATP-binding protein